MNKSNTKKSDKNLWATPWWVFHFAERYFGVKFDLDAAAMAHNTKVKHYLSEQDNALQCCWPGHFCWLNPPYSNPKPFVETAIKHSQQGKTVVMLLNADNSTQWFALCTQHATEIVFITEGRVPFIHNETGKETNQNSKPQMLVLFSPQKLAGVVKTSYISLEAMKNA